MPRTESPLTGTFLVTGAYGCLGVWVIRELLRRGATAVAFDLAADSPRLALVLDGDEPGELRRVRGDVTDRAGLERTLDEHGVDRVVHLAALQVPFCRADPPRGAAVNVVGTANVLCAAAARRDRIPHVAYASSIAAYDAWAPGDAPATVGVPSTIYGVYKRANEHSAARLHADEGVSSVGLRPHTVFGLARDQGLTSAPTTAMLAAAAGRPYTIPYGGSAQLQYARDVAAAFVAAATLDGYAGASVHDLPGPVVSMPEVAAAIAAAAPDAPPIAVAGDPLPFPPEFDSSSARALLGPLEATPFADAVAATIARFRAALADGRVTTAPLDA